MMGHTDDETPAGEPFNLLLVAVKRPQVISLLERFQAANLRADILQSDCLALHNFVTHERLAAGEGEGEPAQRNAAVAVLDIGGDSSNVVVSSPGSVWFRSNGIGGISFTKSLVREFNLTFAQAEQHKRAPLGTRRGHEFEAAFNSAFEDLIKEIEVSFASLAKGAEQLDVREILGVGGGFQLHGLLRYLRLGR